MNEQSDYSKVSLWTIIQKLTSGQVLGVVTFIGSVFGLGFLIANFVATANANNEKAKLTIKHERDVSELAKKHAIEVKKLSDQRDEQMMSRISSDGKLENLKLAVASSMSEAENSILELEILQNSHKAKVEFFRRYISYLESPEKDGAMFKLFSDHVCSLWRKQEKKSFSMISDNITLETLERTRRLDTQVIRASKRTLRDYEIRKLKGSGVSEKDIDVVQHPEDYSQTQYTEAKSRIESLIGDGLFLSKSIQFFDGEQIDVPHAIANHIHNRTDCKP